MVLVEVLERDTVIMDVKDEKYEALEVGDVMRV